MNKQTYFVKRLRLLNYLISKGFSDYKVIPDPTATPKEGKVYNWFVFDTTPELLETISEYFRNLNK